MSDLPNIKENLEENLDLYEKARKALPAYGVFYILILALLVVVGAFYVMNINYVTRMSIAPPVYDTTKAKPPQVFKRGTLSPPVDVKLYVNPGALVLDRGRELYVTNCASCHGDQGNGDGVAGVNLNPRPRNFHSLEGWTNGYTIDAMYKTLQEGITTRGMASYSNLPPSDRLAIIEYIRDFNPAIPNTTITDYQTLDAMYNLTKGSLEPNMIPVESAIERMVADYVNGNELKMDTVRSKIVNDKDNPDAQLFKRIVRNMDKALTSLMGNSKWNENENEFVNFIMTNPVQNGFRPEAISLTPDEWTRVYNYIKGLYSQYNMFAPVPVSASTIINLTPGTDTTKTGTTTSTQPKDTTAKK
ncbi:MAG TPA: cytochrome c [Ignavibacteria bacterium]|nr:cytochrome c [Ignavibacteria bacterium]